MAAAVARSVSNRPVGRVLVTAGVRMVAGALLGVIGGLLHPHRELPNNHPAVFAEYAASTDWPWVHDLQFAAALTVVAGFVVLYEAMSRRGTITGLVERGALGTAVATVAVFAVNMAVDGVALKRRASMPGASHLSLRRPPASPPPSPSAGWNGAPTRSSRSSSG